MSNLSLESLFGHENFHDIFCAIIYIIGVFRTFLEYKKGTLKTDYCVLGS